MYMYLVFVSDSIEDCKNILFFKNAFLNYLCSNNIDDSNMLIAKENSHDQCIENILDEGRITRKTRARPEKRPLHSTRYDGSKHKMEKSKTRQRCKMEHCKFKSFIICVQCEVHLCIKKRNCFDKFHKT